jgi:hypothetical protein
MEWEHIIDPLAEGDSHGYCNQTRRLFKKPNIKLRFYRTAEARDMQLYEDERHVDSGPRRSFPFTTTCRPVPDELVQEKASCSRRHIHWQSTQFLP